MSQQINLYDPSLARQRDWLALTNVVIGAVLLVLLVGATGWLVRGPLPALTAQVASGDNQLKAMRDQIAALGQRSGRKPDARLEQALAGKRELLSLRGEVLATLRNNLGVGAPSYAEYLRGLARQTVSGLWLTGFAVRSGQGMEIRGQTLDPALLPEYIRRLNQEPAFKGQSFAALTLAKPVAASPVAGSSPVTQTSPSTPVVQGHAFTLIPKLEGKTAVSPAPTFATAAPAGGPG